MQKWWAFAPKELVRRGKHRIPMSDIPAPAPTVLRKRSALHLRTLDPTRLHSEDIADIAGRVSRTVHFPVAPEEPTLEMHYFYSGSRNIPFPPDSQGFFYWHIDPDAPPASGQLRFRTASSDSATFSSGCDLQLPDGRIWNIPLFRIARATKYSGLRAHLLCEELVTARLLDTAMKNSAPSQREHRIPESDIPATAAAGPRRRSPLLLRTLDRTRLDVYDFVDITGKMTRNARFPVAPEEPRLQLRYFKSGGRNNIPFPPNTRGFFYWHLEPDAPPLAGQLRFRTTTSSDPDTFPTGRDLQLPDGRIWCISLFDIARISQYSGLRVHLVSEELVTAEVLDTGLHVSASSGARICHPSTESLLIWKFGQRFLVDLPSACMACWIIGSSAAGRLRLPPLSSVCVRESESTGMCYVMSESPGSRISPQTGTHDFLKGVDRRPFTGQALVQLERSTLPEHKGTRTVVLRILKVMTKSDGCYDASWTPESQENGLDMTGIHQHAWSVNVDRPPRKGSLGSLAKALSILFDNEALQGRQDRQRAKL
ncbi:hypothetical protein OE88DRAFT_1740383 [Heliocybe sulcata]|uniref:Uncharacterized protein n=1 Tax=Heliocybe sulcata TaxID=5364 RepID=A0A5C3MM04_9AGAM|nr:hypothetical protein OE88DRAFT_1740383 [Heliocybe sulcata]